jgi:hypothetical protein
VSFLLLLFYSLVVVWMVYEEEYLADDIRLQRLPDLPAAVLRAGTGTCGGYCGYTQCVHDHGSADGYLRFRYQSASSC